jgi:hypothetical protein
MGGIPKQLQRMKPILAFKQFCLQPACTSLHCAALIVYRIANIADVKPIQ